MWGSPSVFRLSFIMLRKRITLAICSSKNQIKWNVWEKGYFCVGVLSDNAALFGYGWRFKEGFFDMHRAVSLKHIFYSQLESVPFSQQPLSHNWIQSFNLKHLWNIWEGAAPCFPCRVPPHCIVSNDVEQSAACPFLRALWIDIALNWIRFIPSSACHCVLENISNDILTIIL